MTFTQHVMTHADYITAGGEPADFPDSYVAIVCTADADVTDEDGSVVHPAGSVVWVSWDHPDVQPEQRLNPDVPARDWRA